jgi:hypothetical protein
MTRSLLLRTLMLWAVLASPAWATDWSVCPGYEEPRSAEEGSRRYELFVSPHTHHWNHSEEHKKVGAFTLSRLLPRDRFCGLSLFRNSFGQPSAYAFTGWSWPHLLASQPEVYATLSAGVIYGYVGQYKNKVPLNIGGFSPVLIPAVGYRISPTVAVEVQILGTAALMFGTTLRF